MREEERVTLRREFRYRCGYCGVRERDAGAELTVDHFQPRSKGGLHESSNWVYSCHACNEFKGDYWEPDQTSKILHPLRDDLVAHLIQDADGRLRGLTETGTFHIDRLHLNRQQLIEFRRDRHRQQSLRFALARRLERVKELDEHVLAIIEELDETDRDEA